MSSGSRVEVWHTLERLLSTDLLRAQAFAGRARAETMRYLLDAGANDDLDAGAVLTEPAALGTPLRAEVLGGLLVRPQTGSLDLKVDPGLLMAIAPDGGFDDSDYKHVRDPGIAVGGALVMGVNAAGSTRIDVIECSINPDAVLETDSRDLYNPVSKLFTATSYTKVKEHRLTYRVRAGTPGAGFPGVAAGWLPLCVASVPDGTTTNDTVTFWDVRPLLSDREFQPHALARAYPMRVRANAWCRPAHLVDGVPSNSTELPLRGVFECTNKGRRVGGRLRRGTPGADANTVDMFDAANCEQGMSLADLDTYHVYLCTPYGLPRWARYTQSGARLPRSPRGMLVLSEVKPNELGIASGVILPPTSTGLVTAFPADDCVFMAGGHWTTYSVTIGPDTFVNVSRSGFHLDENVCTPLAPLGSRGNVVTAVGGGNPFDETFYDLVPGQHFPKCAKAVLLSVFIKGALVEGTDSPGLIKLYEPGSTTNILNWVYIPKVVVNHVHAVASTPGDSAAAKDASVLLEAWIPLPHPYPDAWGATQRVGFRYEMASGSVTAATATVRGWRF